MVVTEYGESWSITSHHIISDIYWTCFAILWCSSWLRWCKETPRQCDWLRLLWVEAPPYFGCDRGLISESLAYLLRRCFCIRFVFCLAFAYLCICLCLYLCRPRPYFEWDRKLISESWAHLQRWRPWQSPYKVWLSQQVIHHFYWHHDSGFNWALIKSFDQNFFQRRQKYDLSGKKRPVCSHLAPSLKLLPGWLTLLLLLLLTYWPPPTSYRPCFF